ncbi:flagellar hook protein FlgL [Leclercia adecarboxylata]|nr:flagellar hook protein FlgL [Leclercia adecarboxylata]KMN61738.1 flagellar hook protein FlgL [Leclercia sp. LK8]
MRLSTLYMYQNSINSMNSAVSNNSEIYSRLSAGQTLLKPSDDPAGASESVVQQSALANMNRYDTARMSAQDALGQEDNTLSSISNLLTKNLSEKIVAGGNGAYSDADRAALATELQGIRDNLIDLANTKDSNGHYMFSGYKTGTQPFNKADGSYLGGDTALTQIVSDSTEMQVGHTGKDIFMSGTSDDLFVALDKAIAALNQPISESADPDAARKALQDTLDATNKTIKKGIDHLGKVQAEVGTNLQQIETLGFSSDNQKINLITRLQKTVGADENATYTLISSAKMSDFAVNSSMLVFQAMQKMSIFNMI